MTLPIKVAMEKMSQNQWLALCRPSEGRFRTQQIRLMSGAKLFLPVDQYNKFFEHLEAYLYLLIPFALLFQSFFLLMAIFSLFCYLSGVCCSFCIIFSPISSYFMPLISFSHFNPFCALFSYIFTLDGNPLLPFRYFQSVVKSIAPSATSFDRKQQLLQLQTHSRCLPVAHKKTICGEKIFTKSTDLNGCHVHKQKIERNATIFSNSHSNILLGGMQSRFWSI